MPHERCNKMSSGCCVSYGLCYNVYILLCFHQARAIWCYCSDKVYLVKLILKSVIFYSLREWCAVVNEMLLIMAGDIESNPGPREYLYHASTPKLSTCSTSSHMCGSELLCHCSPPIFEFIIESVDSICRDTFKFLNVSKPAKL